MHKIVQIHDTSKEDLLKDIGQLIDKKIDILQSRNKINRKYSVKELAEHCGVSDLTVRNWIKAGKLKAKKIDRLIFISEKEFQKALSEVKSLKYKRS